jgi:WS/DGAT/MGAT family acyltransferase
MSEPRATPMEPGDAFMLKFEGPNLAFHYINGWHLDTTARGRPVSLAEIVAIAPPYLAVTPRLTQRAEKRSRKWHWVDDDAFDIRHHVEERTVSGADGFEALVGELSGAQLDRSRPLWKISLVHGLPDGRQAVLARIHHSMMDGLAASNLFRALTSDASGTPPVIAERSAPAPGTRPALPARVVNVARLVRKQRARTKEYGPGESIPRSWLRRTLMNPKVSQPERSWSGTSIPLTDFQELAGLMGANVMGSLHATIAQALRLYLMEKDALPEHRMIANFGIVENKRDLRCDGNLVATARVWMPIEIDDPLELARITAESCQDALALRRHRGMELQYASVEFAWPIPILQRWFGNLAPLTPVHLHTAFIADPAEPRWFHDVAAVGWISSAVPVPPAALSISVHSFVGRMWVGAVATPSAVPDPARFLELLEQSLEQLIDLARKQPAPA